jgi:putative transcriptional regulator
MAVSSVTVGRGRVSNNVRRLREAAAMTQADLGERVGATRQTIIAIEAEKYAPSLELAFKLARAFERPFDDVFQFHATD